MDVVMPQLGETVAEGKISAWFRSVGDQVNAGDNLFEVETDKTAMEVPTLISGVITEIRVSAGQTVPIGTVVAVIGDKGAAAAPAPPKIPLSPAKIAERPPASNVSSPAIPPAAAQNMLRARAPYDPFREVRAPDKNHGPARLPNGITITPLARRVAAEKGIDARAVRGSGPRGRLLARDVEQQTGSASSAPALNEKLTALFDPKSFEITPHDTARRLRAEAATAAKQSIPHFYLRRDVSLDSLLALLESANSLEPALHVTLRDCVVKALGMALDQVDEANVRWTDDHMLRFRQADIAVGTITGGIRLIRAANRKSLGAIAREMAAPANPEAQEFSGVSAIWDQSENGVTASAAIVRPPHVTALTVGAIEQCAAVREGRITTESRCALTLSCDHRAIDGVVGARLLSACVALLERPMALIL
jgi:pyruvate dehydrogenase E2 component (dihydrolipoamide acetyltransferase)